MLHQRISAQCSTCNVMPLMRLPGLPAMTTPFSDTAVMSDSRMSDMLPSCSSQASTLEQHTQQAAASLLFHHGHNASLMCSAAPRWS
jgi:hypothetical protein